MSRAAGSAARWRWSSSNAAPSCVAALRHHALDATPNANIPENTSQPAR